jgi:hypothetical protein
MPKFATYEVVYRTWNVRSYTVLADADDAEDAFKEAEEQLRIDLADGEEYEIMDYFIIDTNPKEEA